MLLRRTSKSVGAESGFATRGTQQRDRNRAGAGSGEGRAHAPRSGLRVVLRRCRRQDSERIGNGIVAELEKGAETVAVRQGSQRTPKRVHEVRGDVWRKCSAPCSKRTKSIIWR